MNLSVVIITKNEEVNIGRCLEAVKWADEIVVVDSQSTDRTLEIAGAFGARTFASPWKGYGQAKREGVNLARGRWILSVDADEVVSAELSEQIRRVVNEPSRFTGYHICRKTNFLGRWILHGGWYPDRVLRLFVKANGNFTEAAVHEQVVLNGEAGHLGGELLHYSYPSLEKYLQKSNRYTTLGAQEAWRSGKRSHWWDMVVRPPVAFVKHYISRQGFRDGWEGLIIAVMSATAVFIKYAKLRQLQRRAVHPESETA
ncbi:MAG TPA: glycosyltransferase family 2 protein [Candidatus Deferrimicrobium sp.]|nr:glycosyltransferase family 2 protein [Candidatus Deferrimicrobium sp.]